ncbi:MAG: hypothetical protein ACRDE2_02525 [Chitinophagaceae bacterium]
MNNLAKNDPASNKKFPAGMEVKDGNFGSDFSKGYDEVKGYTFIAYTIDDDRKVKVVFSGKSENQSV